MNNEVFFALIGSVYKKVWTATNEQNNNDV